MPGEPPVLWQFRQSHFNEKIRWALDWKGIPHVRRSVLPGPHVPVMLWLTGQKQVPVLILDGRPVTDSTAIIAALEARNPDPPLYPSDPALRERALALEDFFDCELGPHMRRAFFHAVLPDTDFAAALLATGFGPVAQTLYRAAFPAVRAIMRLDLRIDDAGAERSRAKIAAALDRIAAELGPQGYLVGDRFSVADLTAAALLYPIVQPPEHPYQAPSPMPAAAEVFRASFANHPAFRWARDLYRRHRGVAMELAA
jgi:glutathione S-transferase